MSTDIDIHGCEEVRVTTHYQNNSNAIAISFYHGNERLDLTVYGLPKGITQKLMLAFSDEYTTVDEECGKEKAASS